MTDTKHTTPKFAITEDALMAASAAYAMASGCNVPRSAILAALEAYETLNAE